MCYHVNDDVKEQKIRWVKTVLYCRAAEDELNCKPPGYFLIRVSESRVGYTLSYR